LNDWALYLLVKQLGKQIFSDINESKLFVWFILNKMHYDVKIGISGSRIVLMSYCKSKIFATPNYTFGAKKFYLLSYYAKGNVGSVYTYRLSYPESNKAIDLTLKQLPKFEKDLQLKERSFQEYGKEYTVAYKYNKNIVDFMATYPQVDYKIFFNTPIENETYYELAKNLKKHIDGKHASEAVNFVLHFVQKAFAYEVDTQQFGREKVMFAEETLYFDKSDCEDRAILFAYLVKKLFGIGVVGVKYKDHMATALYIPLIGDSVKIGQKKYVIADPTYVNATIGQSMPKYRSLVPEGFIRVKRN
jgi:hypothetical protein